MSIDVNELIETGELTEEDLIQTFKANDRRDRRDPRLFGVLIRVKQAENPEMRVRDIIDHFADEFDAIPPYTGEGEGICQEQVAKYRAEFPDGLPEGDDPSG